MYLTQWFLNSYHKVKATGLDLKRLSFAAKECAEGYTDKQTGQIATENKGLKCTFCVAISMGECYWETIGGKKLPLAAKGCTEEFKSRERLNIS